MSLIPVAEVARATGPEWVERSLKGVSVGRTWDDQPAIPEPLATQIVADYKAVREAHAKKERAYKEYLERREAERNEVGSAAWRDGWQRGLLQERARFRATSESTFWVGPVPLSERDARDRAGEFRAEALSEFDRKNPVVDFPRFKG